jgi:hypothetical protein
MNKHAVRDIANCSFSVFMIVSLSSPCHSFVPRFECRPGPIEDCLDCLLRAAQPTGHLADRQAVDVLPLQDDPVHVVDPGHRLAHGTAGLRGVHRRDGVAHVIRRVGAVLVKLLLRARPPPVVRKLVPGHAAEPLGDIIGGLARPAQALQHSQERLADDVPGGRVVACQPREGVTPYRRHVPLVEARHRLTVARTNSRDKNPITFQL